MIALALLLMVAQHEGHAMPGMTMPAPKATRAKTKAVQPRTAPRRATRRQVTPSAKSSPKPMTMPVPVAACSLEHAAMGHCTPAAAPATKAAPMAMPMPDAASSAADSCTPEHAAMGHCIPAPAAATNAAASGTDLPAGNAPPPPAPRVGYSEPVYGPALAAARTAMYREHGGMAFSQVMFNLAEVQIRDGRDGYRWDGEGWFGGDINRLVIKSEGRGSFGRPVEDAEVQALYSRAIGPYFNLQGGARYDIRPDPSRAYAVLGIEGLAPYWFDVEAALFVAGNGDVLARAEASYDQRITQRLILQPRAEVNFAVQDDPRRGVGSGISDLELGLRLRYEIAREFAPYVGVSWDRKLGDTARFARAAGEGASDASVVAGIRVWF